MGESAERKTPIIFGTRIEKPDVNLWVATPMIGIARLFTLIKGFEISGAEYLPKQGPFIVTSKHTSALQTLMLPEAVMEITGRSVAMVAGHTKLFPREPEDPSILAKTGEEPFEEKSWKGKLGAEFRGFLLREICALPIHRFRPYRAEMRDILEALKSGQITGFFLDMSRTVDTVHDGVSWVASQLPDLPVVPAYTDGKILDRNPFQAAFGEPRYFRDYLNLPKREAIAAMTQDLERNIYGLQKQVNEMRIKRLLGTN